MTLEEKVGAMLVYGWSETGSEDATAVNSHAREIVEDMRVGGVVLLGRNVADDLSVTVSAFNELQSLSREPLFIIADQEGGMVARFTQGVTVFPSNMALGATGRVDHAYEAAAAVARELVALGVNYNFAPCVDVNNNPDNPIIGTRSYGESPDMVARFGAAAIRGYQDNGVIACAKHFPGHGDTAVDSHLALPSVPYPRQRLDSLELVPFVEAIRSGVSSIMTTHIIFPALDTGRPATLSPAVITGLLRGELGYDGVVVTDCMEMKAIADNFGTAEAAVMAVEAGVDLVLVCHTLSTQREAREAILKAVIDGRITESRLDESVRRIRALKQKYRLNDRRFTDFSATRRALRTPETLRLRDSIAADAVTLVRSEDRTIPLRPEPGQNVLVMGLHSSVKVLARAVQDYAGKIEALELQGEAADVIRRAEEAASRADVVIIPTCPNEPWKSPTDQDLQARLVRTIAASGAAKLIVVAVREPYDLRAFPDVPAYICAYGYREASCQAAAAVIFGRAKPTGRLPVTIPL